MMFLQVPALAIVLLLILRTFQLLFLKVVASTRYRHFFLKWFPVFEISLWLIYVFWALVTLFGDSSSYSFISASFIIVILAVCGWYFLRDFIAGFILRSENKLETGQEFKVDDTEGIISHTGYRSLQLTTNNGDKVKIPYSTLAGKKLILPSRSGQLTTNRLSLAFESGLLPEEIQQRLKQRLLEMPWVLSSEPPEIRLDIDQDSRYHAEIELRVVNEESLMMSYSLLLDFVKKEL
jgi:small-conductance mechanosensitive channel